MSIRVLAAACAAAFLTAACQTRDLTRPPDGGPGPGSVTARVVASDASHPAGVNLSGTATFSGLTVELWNGSTWLTVVKDAGSATIDIGNGTAQATLAPATEIPAGTYNAARVTAANAAIDLTVSGQNFSTRVQTAGGGQPVTIERTVTVTVNPDGSRTFAMQLELVRSVTLAAPAGVPMVTIAGDLGTMSAPALAAPAQVVASDASRPTVSPAGASVSGTVTFNGLAVLLWNGQQWVPVTGGSGSATIQMGDGTAQATLVPVGEVPAGTYTQIRLQATQAVVDLSLTMDGRQFAAAAAVPTAQPLVIDRDVTVTVNPDGSRTFAVQLDLVRSVVIDQSTGVVQVSVSGALGTVTATASSR